jgi:DUF1365 family protein
METGRAQPSDLLLRFKPPPALGRGSGVSVSALYQGTVVHRRHAPRRHRLAYRVFSLFLDLDELPGLHRRLRLFGYNRPALFSFLDRDHGRGDGSDLKQHVKDLLHPTGLAGAIASVRILCYPRVLGYVFNPLSVYYCYGVDGKLLALVYEVNNTHGERHSYVIPARQQGPAITQACDKAFFVSPFLPMDCRYQFQVKPPGERLSLLIRETHQDAPILDAWFVGRRRELSDASLLRAAFSYPLLTFKIIAGIHWEALKLLLKGLRIHRHEASALHGVSLIDHEARHTG